jgi:hypothetical protein
MVAKYGNFNQGIYVTNVAYDTALIIRNAQSYGLNVKSKERTSNVFDVAYGAHIEETPGGGTGALQFFADIDKDGLNDDDSLISSYVFKTGTTFSSVRAGADESSLGTMDSVDITFRRPNPNAIIYAKPDGSDTSVRYNYVELTIRGVDGSTKKVAVRNTGQISVTD